MKTILEYLNKDSFENRVGSIIFELDEDSKQYLSPELQYIMENNRVVWTSNDGDDLLMGNHSNDRLDRSLKDGGDGFPIDKQEVIDLFRYTWDDMLEEYNNGDLDTFEYKGRDVESWVTQLHCYLTEKKSKLYPNGARPQEKTLWTAWMIEEKEGYKLDIIIRTLFRGERLKHVRPQERIYVTRKGEIQQISY